MYTAIKQRVFFETHLWNHFLRVEAMPLGHPGVDCAKLTSILGILSTFQLWFLAKFVINCRKGHKKMDPNLPDYDTVLRMAAWSMCYHPTEMPCLSFHLSYAECYCNNTEHTPKNPVSLQKWSFSLSWALPHNCGHSAIALPLSYIVSEVCNM